MQTKPKVSRGKTIHLTSYVEVYENDLQWPDGRKQTQVGFGFKDFCNLIAVTDTAEVVIVDQFRAAIQSSLFEFPGGLIDQNEVPQRAALRELREETGYELHPGGRVVDLGWVYPNPAIQTNRCYSFVCGPVLKKHTPQLDPGESLSTKLFSLEALLSMVLYEELPHALMLTTLFGALKQQPDRSLNGLSEWLRGFSVPTVP